MPRNVTEAIALIILAMFCVVAIVILSLSHDNVPNVLADIAFVAIGGGAGVARQNFNNRRP